MRKNEKKFLPVPVSFTIIGNHAGVAELADAYGSGPYGGNPVKVQVLSPAPLIERAPAMGLFSCPDSAFDARGARCARPFSDVGRRGRWRVLRSASRVSDLGVIVALWPPFSRK